MEQYNQPIDPDKPTVKPTVNKPESSEQRMNLMDNLIAQQQRELTRLQREISRLKDDIAAITLTIRNNR